jgi:CRISPR/Cas system-associated exonuclease Cas4 (RecB family)
MIKNQGKFVKILPQDRRNYFHLSVSKTKTFKQCKAKYHFNYIQKLPRKDWEHLDFGSLLHEALENFEKAIIAGNKEKYHILMKKCFSSALKNWPKITQDQKKEAFDILSSFLKKRINCNSVPIAAEKEFTIDIGNNILLNGFIDLVKMDPDGVLHVGDYKTSKSGKWLEKDYLQLKTYAYAMCLEDPNLELVRCSYIMLKLDFEEIKFEFSREEAMTIEQDFRDYTTEIAEEKLFRPSTGPLCPYCDYSEHCPDGLKWIKQAEERNNKKTGTKKFGETEW